MPRVRREGYAANKVGHPNVVKVLDDDVVPTALPAHAQQSGRRLALLRRAARCFIPSDQWMMYGAATTELGSVENVVPVIA